MTDTTAGMISDEYFDLATRPDRDLPPVLRHEKIRDVRDVSTVNEFAYEIVFEQHYLPISYWNPKPDGWEITSAHIEYHNEYSGILGWLLPDREGIAILVTHDRDQIISGGHDE